MYQTPVLSIFSAFNTVPIIHTIAMGICFSSESDESRVSAQIDKKIEEDSRRLRRECKILLLGNY